MKFPKPKKVKLTSLKKKADILFSKFIRSIGYCQAAGRTGNITCAGPLQCAHIVPRNVLRLRWSQYNAACLCTRHHLFYFHRNPLEFIEFINQYYPEKMEYVQKHRYEVCKMTTEKYQELIKKLSETKII